MRLLRRNLSFTQAVSIYFLTLTILGIGYLAYLKLVTTEKAGILKRGDKMEKNIGEIIVENIIGADVDTVEKVVDEDTKEKVVVIVVDEDAHYNPELIETDDSTTLIEHNFHSDGVEESDSKVEELDNEIDEGEHDSEVDEQDYKLYDNENDLDSNDPDNDFDEYDNELDNDNKISDNGSNDVCDDEIVEHDYYNQSDELDNDVDGDEPVVSEVIELIHDEYTENIVHDTIPVKDDLFELIESRNIGAFRDALEVVEIDQIWNAKGYNLLHFAVINQSIPFIKEIVANGPSEFVNEKTRDEVKFTALHLAAANAEISSEVLSVLIQSGADVDGLSSDDPEYGFTPLFAALTFNNQEAMRVLLIHGANVNISYQGSPLLHHAFIYSNMSAIQLLLDHNADHLLVNILNRTALHEAVVLDKVEIVRLLINQYKCDVNARTPTKSHLKKRSNDRIKRSKILYSATPLHYAIKEGHVLLGSELIQMGAERFAKDGYGKTPWFYDEMVIGSLIFTLPPRSLKSK